ncbi:hypothetical protein UAJ10_25175 [Nitrospirillum sp. BR 11164]|uniref:hypothetical protein n=1 Tax=Nitrospirillum sp. BR 11164 TaxID=3104324 RepID=UPI002AFF952F|nr:hypothetical protein [Nitrospirillum sp. BR 11164]MEA1652288.1 hypothetical protein [Nitrospirillum sp. BR 11164]
MGYSRRVLPWLTATAISALSACTGQPAHAPAAANNSEPTCFGAPYALDKGAYDSQTALAGDPSPVEELPGQAQRIQLQTQHLTWPREIAAIRRGYISHFAGGFINDGLVHWLGVDLDRKLLIVVDRRIHNPKGEGPALKPVADPTFREWDRDSYARKWTDGTITEIEVVWRTKLNTEELTAFVCVANGYWRSPRPKDRMVHMISDAVAATSTLLDRAQDGKRLVAYSRTVPYRSDAFDSVLRFPTHPQSYSW